MALFGRDDKRKSKEAAARASAGFDNLRVPSLPNATFQRISAPRVSAPSASGVFAKAYSASPTFAQASLAPFSRLVQEGIVTPGPRVDPMMVMSRDVATPQLAAPNRLGTAFDMIRENPELKLAQMEALGMFREMSKEGMTAEDLAALHEIFSREQQEFKAQRQGIEGQMARRGTLGSGMELAAKLQGAQDQSVIAHDQATDVAAMNHQARREGTMAYADLAGQMRDQDYGMQRDKALATDDMGRYNEDNLQRVNLSNADFQLRASLANADNQLRASMANQGTKLQADTFNSDTITRTNMANVDNNLRSQMANQGMETDINTTNAGLKTDVSKFNAGTATDVSKFNAAQRTNVSMHNSDVGTRVNLANADMSLRSRLANASNTLQARQFNATGNWQQQMAQREAVTWQWAQEVGLADRRVANQWNSSNYLMDRSKNDSAEGWNLINGITNVASSVLGFLF